MATYLGRRFKILRKTPDGLQYQDAGPEYKRTPDVIRELYVHEYKAIIFAGEQSLLESCYRNSKPLGERCIQALVEIYRALNYPAKPYTVTPEGIYWRDKPGTLVPIPCRYHGTLNHSQEHSSKPLMVISEALYRAHKSTLLNSENTPGGLSPSERAFIARKTGPLHGTSRQTAQQATLFD